MSTILVLGGGVIGLSMAMMLARQSHDVTVFERDSEPLPGSPETRSTRGKDEGSLSSDRRTTCTLPYAISSNPICRT
jgi:phytoene dehydrogenase-like protein